jgi:ketosteroid isomerase-like protein
MQRDDMLAKVDAAYQARRTGDFAALGALVAPDAEFTTAGDESLVGQLPGARGVGVHQAARELFDTIELRTLERVEAVAEGNRVAILWRTTAAVPRREPFETLMFDLWEFNDSGKICRGTQFVDTAKFVEVMRPRAEAFTS